MSPGPRPTPTAKAAILGFPGKRARNLDEPQPPIAPALPTCPEWLGEDGLAHWNQQAPVCYGMGTLTTADPNALARLCAAYQLIRDCDRALAGGLTVASPNNGPIARPEVSIRFKAIADYHRWSVELGLTPASRTRIKATVPTPVNPVDAFKAQRPTHPLHRRLPS
jgi:P27 family predicted phage terminase small subunit